MLFIIFYIDYQALYL